MQGPDSRVDFFMVNNVRKRVEAKVHFLIDKNIAFSPYRSLFGSYEFNPVLSLNLLRDFVQYSLEELYKRSVVTIKLIHHAQCYYPEKSDKIHQALLTNQFRISLQAINHHIRITDTPLVKRMHLMEKRRLIKCQKSGLRFSIDLPSEMDNIYAFIKKCRMENDLEISIEKEKLKAYLEQFPQNYWLISVRSGEEILAATVAIKVNRKIVYNFLPASLRQYNDLSPMVMLIDGLYQHLSHHQYELLDLGISTLHNGIHQKSLIQFKERMGAEPSWKNSYEINL